MKPKRLVFFLWIALSTILGVAIWRTAAPPSAALRPAAWNLAQLLVDVFDPQTGEKVLVLVDVPVGGTADNSAWADRRQLAVEWQAAWQQLAAGRGFEVYPLLSYPATGAHNGPLPEYGEMAVRQVRLEQVFAEATLVLALTEYSATAPLFELTERYPNLRAASLPMVARSMQQTALAADYAQVAERVHLLADRLDRAEGAEIEFSTGDRLSVDLRNRPAFADDGQLPPEKAGERVINLPSGEAYSAPYEGELTGMPSRTAGVIPWPANGGLVKLWVEANRVVGVTGEQAEAAGLREWFAVDPARSNLAELGLGANDRAVVSGNVLEDEKAFGVHLAFGRSDHIGGTVGPDDFQAPANIVHRDVVYARGAPVVVSSLVLVSADGSRELIFRAGGYPILSTGLVINAKLQLLAWLVLTAAALAFWKFYHDPLSH